MQFPLLCAVSLSSFLSAVSVSMAADSSYSRCRGGTFPRCLSSKMGDRPARTTYTRCRSTRSVVPPHPAVSLVLCVCPLACPLMLWAIIDSRCRQFRFFVKQAKGGGEGE